jgi:hypothetical protein
LALCEAYYLSGKSPILKSRCQHAVNYAQRARNPYGGWRYEVPANGESDTSVTGWMVFALASARDAGLVVDDGALASALAYFDEMTDPGSGRVGYSEPGGASSRVRGINDHYPVDASETMTSVALLGRIFLDQEPGEHPVLEKHAELVVRELPSWSEDGLSNDLYGWYYGTYAMYQMSTFEPSYWKRWNEAMKSALVDHQRKDGDFQGSWDPNGPWGRSGGRVYSTALGVLCLEVYYRYARVLGGR